MEWEHKGRRYHFNGSLISHYIREETTKLYKVTFANEIKILFAPACWTQLEWEERRALKGHPQAQWMHSYFSSHAKPFPVSPAFLHEKSGSRRTSLNEYRKDLRKALATLKNVLGWQASWGDDLITYPPPQRVTGTTPHHEDRHQKAQAAIEAQEKGFNPGRRSHPRFSQVLKKARI